MYIKSLVYEDQSTNWKLELIEFKPLTLLVGVSGVGKTQILKALLNLKEIAHGSRFNGFKWEIDFTSNQGREYKWRGEFESTIFYPDRRFSFERSPEPQWNAPPVYYERLFIDGELIIDRNGSDIFFENKKTVQLPRDESVVYLLKEEERIKEVFENFDNIIFDDFNAKTESPNFWTEMELEAKLNHYKSLELLRNSNETIKNKLYLCCKNNHPIFKEIESLFIEIFPSIEKIMVDNLTSMFGNMIRPSVAIKERGVPGWIHQGQMSSGMFRSLMHLAELYLCKDGSVILIDEFENSLGINCINAISHSILASERDLQFIITSHHPYIINDIGFAHWKIVTRKGGVVTAIDADKLGIGKSKHQAFTQLINLTAYSEGIDS